MSSLLSSINKNAQKHVKRKSTSSRGLCMHIVKLRDRGWESRFQNKILLPWAEYAEGHFVSLLPNRRLFLPLQSLPSSPAITTTRTEPNYSPALHPMSHSHTHVSTSHHTPLPARHITPHTQRLCTLHQPHGQAERERRLELLGLRLGLGQSERLIWRGWPHKAPCVSHGGQDVTRATWLMQHSFPY